MRPAAPSFGLDDPAMPEDLAAPDTGRLGTLERAREPGLAARHPRQYAWASLSFGDSATSSDSVWSPLLVIGGDGGLGQLRRQVGTGLGHAASVKSRGHAVVTDRGEIIWTSSNS